MNKWQAYLVGAYLTDGCVSENQNGWRMFTLEVIDKDFALKVLRCLDECGDKSGQFYERLHDKKPYYKAYSGSQELCRWLQNKTNFKKEIPIELFDAPKEVQREFVSGMLDGDGYISQYKNGWLGVMGFAVTDLWVYQFAEMLHKLGVQTSTPRMETKNRKKPLYRFRINKPTFIKAGLYFSVERKQRRLNQIRSSETTCEDAVLTV